MFITAKHLKVIDGMNHIIQLACSPRGSIEPHLSWNVDRDIKNMVYPDKIQPLFMIFKHYFLRG